MKQEVDATATMNWKLQANEVVEAGGAGIGTAPRDRAAAQLQRVQRGRKVRKRLSGWEKQIDTESMQAYWYNADTGESSWDPPAQDGSFRVATLKHTADTDREADDAQRRVLERREKQRKSAAEKAAARAA